MTYSTAGLALTKLFEGLRLTAYQDSGGVWTIGYGHTGSEVVEGLTWTQDQADAQLLIDTQTAQDCVNTNVTILSLTQNQFDALVDLAYNIGCGALRSSLLLRCVNAGKFDAAAQQFTRWVYAGGKVVDGLMKRRQAEQVLFSSPQQQADIGH